MQVQTATPGPPPRTLQEPRPQVLAYESSQDQVTLYGLDGQPLSTPPRDHHEGFLHHLLLPSKMPESVSPDYLPSRKWSFLMEAAGATQSYLGTAAALGAVGIGNGPLTVGLAWMMRDSIDGIGKFVGSQFGRQADRDPKGWVTKGEYVHAAGMMMESTLAVAPQAFLALAPTANIVKAFGATVKGAAQAPIELHQARDNNLGEVRSKNNNQSMIASMVGGALGFGLEKLGAHFIGGAATPVLMAGATAARLLGAHQYVNALELDPVTEKRLLTHLRKWLELPRQGNTPKNLEQLQLGAPLAGFVENPVRFEELRALYGDRNYLLDLQQGEVMVTLHEKAGLQDQLQAVVQASLIRLLQKSVTYHTLISAQGHEAARDWLLATSLAATPEAVSSFAYDRDNPLRFQVDARRAHWDKLPSAPLAEVSKDQLKALLKPD